MHKLISTRRVIVIMASLAVNLLASLRFKDCLLVSLCLLFTYLLRIRDSVTFDPAFEIPVDVSLYPNGKYFESHRALPKPIVTDLEGDRRNEIVVIDNDFKIKIFHLEDEEAKSEMRGKETRKMEKGDSEETSNTGDCYDQLRVVMPRVENQLPQHYAETGTASHPVAMATGVWHSFHINTILTILRCLIPFNNFLHFLRFCVKVTHDVISR